VATPEDITEPEWEILNLLREVRRRAKSASVSSYLAGLREEPRWVSALPAAEAKIARTMLEATREMAMRAADPLGELTEHAEARPRKASRRRSR
jgi:hypothetical protein